MASKSAPNEKEKENNNKTKDSKLRTNASAQKFLNSVLQNNPQLVSAYDGVSETHGDMVAAIELLDVKLSAGATFSAMRKQRFVEFMRLLIS
jgi:hypothetical protein